MSDERKGTDWDFFSSPATSTALTFAEDVPSPPDMDGDLTVTERLRQVSDALEALLLHIEHVEEAVMAAWDSHDDWDDVDPDTSTILLELFDAARAERSKA